MSGMDAWCKENCRKGNCPSHLCACPADIILWYQNSDQHMLLWKSWNSWYWQYIVQTNNKYTNQIQIVLVWFNNIDIIMLVKQILRAPKPILFRNSKYFSTQGQESIYELRWFSKKRIKYSFHPKLFKNIQFGSTKCWKVSGIKQRKVSPENSALCVIRKVLNVSDDNQNIQKFMQVTGQLSWEAWTRLFMFGSMVSECWSWELYLSMIVRQLLSESRCQS